MKSKRTQIVSLLILCALTLVFVACEPERKVRSITLSCTTIEMVPGEERQIEVRVDPLSATIYNLVGWKTSNPNVAIVEGNGTIRAVYAGVCTITATCGKCTASCTVFVHPPDYKFVFANALHLDSILYLYPNTLEFDSVGSVEGNGLFLRLPIESLAEGLYIVGDSAANSIAAGRLEQFAGAYYAVGTYLGQYSDDGLSVLFAESGNVEVRHGEHSTVECTLYGAAGETIRCSFEGDVEERSLPSQPPIQNIVYYSTMLEYPRTAHEESLNHVLITLYTVNYQIELMARTPLSAERLLPNGRYQLSEREQPYTLMHAASFSPCIMMHEDDTALIVSAEMRYDGSKFAALLTTDKNERFYVSCQNDKSSEN